MKSLTRKGGDLRTDGAAAGDRTSTACAVEGIADQSMAQMGEMNPDLMGPTRGQTALNPSRIGLICALDLIASDRWFSLVLTDDGHFLAVYGAATDITSDLAGGWDGYPPDEGSVGARNLACGKIARQRLVRRLGFRGDHDPARILVETMHNSGAAEAADAGEVGTAMAEQGIDEGSVWVSRGRMDNHAGRLVDDNQVCILETDIERDMLRLRHCIFSLGEYYDEILATSHAEGRVTKYYPILRHKAVLDQAFEPRPRQFREMRREHAIEPLPAFALAGPDLGRCTGRHYLSHRHSSQ